MCAVSAKGLIISILNHFCNSISILRHFLLINWKLVFQSISQSFNNDLCQRLLLSRAATGVLTNVESVYW